MTSTEPSSSGARSDEFGGSGIVVGGRNPAEVGGMSLFFAVIY
jgi:hypothetical protein